MLFEIMVKFSRPANLSFPQTYHTFEAKNKAGDATIEYQIRELSQDFYEKALEILATDFATEETLCVAKNITGNPMAFNEICYFWHELMKEKISVGCFTNDNELVGVAVMTVECSDDGDQHSDLKVR